MVLMLRTAAEERAAKPFRGKGGRKSEVRGLEWSKASSRQRRKGLRKGQKPAIASGGGWKPRSGWSAGVGAGERRQRTQVVQFGGQAHPACDPGSGVAEGCAEQRIGGSGWAEHGAVCAGAARYPSELQISLEDGSYRPQPVKRVEIPKGDGKTRPLGIPAVKDRIVPTALKMVIEPVPRVRPQGGPRTSFEVQFRPCSYGFRPGRHCKGALREVDGLMERSGRRMVRYADDFVILCRTQAEAEAALREVQAWVAENGLTPHPDKTRIGDCRQAGQGFEFAGSQEEPEGAQGQSEKPDGPFARRQPGTDHWRHQSDVARLVRMHAAPGVFRAIDGVVRRRLRAILRKQEKRPGFGRCKADHQRWPNACFAAHALFTLQTAHASARHSR